MKEIIGNNPTNGKEKRMKQYIIEEAYTGNYHVIQVSDGKIENSRIIPYFELDGYISVLISKGYDKAYFVTLYEMRLLKAKQELELAEEAYNNATSAPLITDQAGIDAINKILFNILDD